MRVFGGGFWWSALGRTPAPVQGGGAVAGAPAHETHHETYVGVQILRGLAVVMVVAFHAGLMVRDRFPEMGERLVALAGAAGVDIFFPISGFVMLVSARRLAQRSDGWRVFAERRIVRIVPLYWLATTLKVLAVLAVPSLALHTDLSWWHGIASYLFVFAVNGRGVAEPVLPVGWTLNYEMFFYAVFAAVLFFRRPIVVTVSTAMAVAVTVGAVVPRGATPLIVLGPLVLEFVAGMWVAQLALSGARLRPAAALALAAAALAALAATCALGPAEVERVRLLVWGVPGAALLLAAVSLEPAIARGRWRLARLTGDASYSIYLSHGFVLALLGVALARAGAAGTAGALFAFAAAIPASVAAGIGVYRWIERPMIDALLRRRRLRAPAPGPAPATAPPAPAA